MPIEPKYAYLAGILDGEGYFSCTPTSHSFGLVVMSTDEVLIDWLCENFSGSHKSRGGVTSAGNQMHRWYVQRQQEVLDIIDGVMPYLVIKGKQALAMRDLIEHLLTRPRYEIPTPYAKKVERVARRERRREWDAKTDHLRKEVSAARKNYNERHTSGRH